LFSFTSPLSMPYFPLFPPVLQLFRVVAIQEASPEPQWLLQPAFNT
jgi:hypothetical protein